jgi:hypothetical protein
MTPLSKEHNGYYSQEIEQVRSMQHFRHERVGGEALKYANVERHRITLKDGKTTLITVIRAHEGTSYALSISPQFLEQSIALDNPLLISQGETKKAWGTDVGKMPQDFLPEDQEGLAFHPTNAGWQLEEFWIKAGQLKLLKNDQAEITGTYTVLGFDGASWRDRRITLNNGVLEEGSHVEDLQVGFSMPLTIQDRRKTPPDEVLTQPRFLADLRNVIDFANGNKMPEAFWLILRKLLPDTAAAVRRLLSGRAVVQRSGVEVTDQEAEQFAQILKEHKLDEYLSIELTGKHRLVIKKQLPFNRIPCFGLGYSKEGQLIVVAADGRQPDSAGVTIEELSEIMLDLGVVTGGVGSAGGDVAITTHDKRLLNSPSNVDPKTQERVARRVPSAFIFHN